MTERTFPVLWDRWDREGKALEVADCPQRVPWDFVAEHRQQCLNNHDQTPERLAERGGLGVAEMVYVVRDERWPRLNQMMTEMEALPELRRLLREWKARTKELSCEGT